MYDIRLNLTDVAKWVENLHTRITRQEHHFAKQADVMSELNARIGGLAKGQGRGAQLPSSNQGSAAASRASCPRGRSRSNH
eukprot:12414472-Karenia_brevis.AAC.1